MTHFVGVIDGAGESWGVRFPDIDGCVGAGATAEEAVANAAEALRDVMSYRRRSSFPSPKARTLAEILASGEVGSAEAAVLIPLLLDTGRSVRANLTFDEGLLEAIDEAAKKRGLTRSAFLAGAAREKIEAQR
jgi:predicted RNase H-like HicB family nuclease